MQKEKDLGVKGNIKSKQKSEQYINRYNKKNIQRASGTTWKNQT